MLKGLLGREIDGTTPQSSAELAELVRIGSLRSVMTVVDAGASPAVASVATAHIGDALALVDEAGREHAQPAVVVVSNNPYTLDRPPMGTRPRLDSGRLGIIVLDTSDDAPAIWVYEPRFFAGVLMYEQGPNAGEPATADADATATALRANGVPCEVAPSAAKFGKQIRHAERRGIPYVWFTSTGDDGAAVHEVKDIRSGDQVAADPATWEPPSQDLRPRVLTTTEEATEEVTAEGETP